MKSHLPLAVALLVFGSAAALSGQTPPAAPAPTLKSGGDDEKMKAFVAANCTNCHEISVLSAAPHEAGEWHTILERMVSYHPPLAETDMKALEAYLVRTYPAPAK